VRGNDGVVHARPVPDGQRVQLDGGCQFTPTTGGTWDAGVGTPAQCMAGSCMLPSLFHFPVSNFAESDLPSTGAALTINCAVTLDASAQTVSTNGCGVTMPPSVTFTPTTSGAQSTLLIRLSSMMLNSGANLVLVGSRPALFAVTGPVVINAGARIRATNGGFGTPHGLGGTSGGGGAGAAGQANGEVTLIPLRGGCPGGAERRWAARVEARFKSPRREC
jgi:hypothetical protein